MYPHSHIHFELISGENVNSIGNITSSTVFSVKPRAPLTFVVSSWVNSPTLLASWPWMETSAFNWARLNTDSLWLSTKSRIFPIGWQVIIKIRTSNIKFAPSESPNLLHIAYGITSPKAKTKVTEGTIVANGLKSSSRYNGRASMGRNIAKKLSHKDRMLLLNN